MKELLKQGPRTINIGLRSFYDTLKKQKAASIHVDWRPPIARKELLEKLKRLRKGI